MKTDDKFLNLTNVGLLRALKALYLMEKNYDKWYKQVLPQKFMIELDELVTDSDPLGSFITAISFLHDQLRNDLKNASNKNSLL